MEKNTIKVWKTKFKNLSFVVWNMDTNIARYLEYSVFTWLDKVTENDYIDGSKYVENKEFCFENSSVVFYESTNRDKLYKRSVFRQLLDTLCSLDIIEEKHSDKYYVNQELLNEFNNLRNAKEAVRAFIQKRYFNLLTNYVLNPLQWNEEELENTSFELTKRKFWWNVLLEIDKRLGNNISELINLDHKISITFNDMVNLIFFNNEDEKSKLKNNYESICANFKKITKLQNQSYFREAIIIDDVNLNEELNSDIIDQIRSRKDKLLTFNVNITQLLSSSKEFTYDLPLFQRTYAWSSDLILGLFESIYDDFEKDKKGETFLNSIIFSFSNWKFQIIDGQQRITSLIIILGSIYKFCKYRKFYKIQSGLNAILHKILDIVKGFKESHLEYDILYNILFTKIDNKEFSKIEKNNFIDNFKEINNLLLQKFDDIDQESFGEFVDYFKKNIHLAFILISKNEEGFQTRIFKNLNQYSKKLGILDLLRNRIYELCKNELDLKKVQEIIDIYNLTINIYFRKKAVISNDEHLELLNTFISGLFIKNGWGNVEQNINEKFSDDTTKFIKKFDFIIEKYLMDGDVKDLLFKIWNDVLEFTYSRFGSLRFLDFLKKYKRKNEQNNILLEMKNKIEEFNKKLSKMNFINYQIYHISNGGSKTVFTSLIWTIFNKMKIFENDNKDSKAINNLSNFSHYLSKIEQFKALWQISFSGQSLTTGIERISRSFNYDAKSFNPEKLYKDLNSNIHELNSFSEWKKISKLYEYLKLCFKKEFKSKDDEKNIKNNKEYATIIGRTFNSLYLTDITTPQYFKRRNSVEESFYELDYTYMTYEHMMPQKLQKETDTKLRNLEIEELVIQSLIHNIGNGCLLLHEDNSKLNNSSSKDYKSKGINNKTTEEVISNDFYLIDFEESEKCNEIIWSDKKIKISKVEKFESPKNKEEFINYYERVKTRSLEIIESYISILFYDLKK